MERTRDRRHESPAELPRHYREQADDASESTPEVVVTTLGPLQVTAEEDTGGDPYNHTGTFRRAVR